MDNSIPQRRSRAASPRQHLVRSHSLLALAVAARLERHHAPAGPPGRARTEEAPDEMELTCSAPDC